MRINIINKITLVIVYLTAFLCTIGLVISMVKQLGMFIEWIFLTIGLLSMIMANTMENGFELEKIKKLIKDR